MLLKIWNQNDAIDPDGLASAEKLGEYYARLVSRVRHAYPAADVTVALHEQGDYWGRAISEDVTEEEEAQADIRLMSEAVWEEWLKSF
jgi:hypothetical protein